MCSIRNLHRALKDNFRAFNATAAVGCLLTIKPSNASASSPPSIPTTPSRSSSSSSRRSTRGSNFAGGNGGDRGYGGGRRNNEDRDRGYGGGNSGGALGSGPQSQTRDGGSAPLNSPHITSALDAHNAPPGPPAGPTTAPTDPLSNTSTPRMTQGGTASPRACLTAVGSNQRAGGRRWAGGGSR